MINNPELEGAKLQLREDISRAHSVAAVFKTELEAILDDHDRLLAALADTERRLTESEAKLADREAAIAALGTEVTTAIVTENLALKQQLANSPELVAAKQKMVADITEALCSILKEEANVLTL